MDYENMSNEELETIISKIEVILKERYYYEEYYNDSLVNCSIPSLE
jgi:hypothetical protein